MSVQAVAYVLYGMGPEEADPLERLVLLVLADHAHPDGSSAYPSQQTIADAVGVSVRTVQRRLVLLLERRVIVPGDQALVSHIASNRRPVVYDIAGCQAVTPSRPRGDDVVSPLDPPGVTESGVRGDTQSVVRSQRTQTTNARAGVRRCDRCGQRVTHDDEGEPIPHARPERGLCHPPAATRTTTTAEYRQRIRGAG